MSEDTPHGGAAGVEYSLTKFLHVLFAIVAVGFNVSYGIWLARAARQPRETHLFTLRTIKLMDDRVANPLYALLAVTGLLMVFQAGYPLTTFWIAAALVLYTLAVLLGFGVITPNFRAQLRALEREGAESQTFRVASARGRLLGILVLTDVAAIVFLMVVKPAF